MPEQLGLMEQREMRALEPIELIRQALSQGTSPEVVRELVALQQSMERFNWEREERQSKKDFDDALNFCQKQIGRIAPNVNRKDTNSWWADYAQLDKTVRPIYTEQGFSIGFSEVEPIAKGKVRIKAMLSRSGISRDYFSEITPTTTGPKGGAMATATDADAIAASRAKRYLVIDIFNISVGIDKEEKKPFAGSKEPGKLDERDNLAHIENIKAANSMEELNQIYQVAQKEADAIGDTASTLEFANAKRERIIALRKEGRA
jgi:hypothetical protein